MFRSMVAIAGSVLLAFALLGCEYSPQPQPAAASPEPAPRAPVVARGNLRFVEGFESGYRQATREGKPMLVFFTAQWCEFCHQMAGEAFVQDQVVSLSDRFVCILVDADREPQVCQQFQVRSYPTVQFLSPLGVPLNRVVGKKPGHQLVIEMHAALQAVARRQAVAEPLTR